MSLVQAQVVMVFQSWIPPWRQGPRAIWKLSISSIIHVFTFLHGQPGVVSTISRHCASRCSPKLPEVLICAPFVPRGAARILHLFLATDKVLKMSYQQDHNQTLGTTATFCKSNQMFCTCLAWKGSLFSKAMNLFKDLMLQGCLFHCQIRGQHVSTKVQDSMWLQCSAFFLLPWQQGQYLINSSRWSCI